MKGLKVFLVLVVLILVTASIAFSEVTRVRVTGQAPNVRVKPQGAIMFKAPLGAVFSVLKKEGAWYLIQLPPENGLERTGYIHQGEVEAIEVAENVQKPVQQVQQKPAVVYTAPQAVKTLDGTPLSEKEKHLRDTDPYYLPWRTKLDQAKASQKVSWKYIWIGGGAFLAGGIAWPLIGNGGRILWTLWRRASRAEYDYSRHNMPDRCGCRCRSGDIRPYPNAG